MSDISIPTPEPIFTTNQFSTLKEKTKEKTEQKQQGKFDKYSHGHFFHYVSTHKLQFNVYNLYSLRNALLHLFRHLLYGGYKENKFVKFGKKQTPLIIIKLQLIRKVQDKNNSKFYHHFIECQYFGEERFTNLIDVIVNEDFLEKFTKELRKYNIKLSKGLHYIDAEMKEPRSSLIHITQRDKNINGNIKNTEQKPPKEEDNGDDDDEYIV